MTVTVVNTMIFIMMTVMVIILPLSVKFASLSFEDANSILVIRQ